jgi:hypothetical protein
MSSRRCANLHFDRAYAILVTIGGVTGQKGPYANRECDWWRHARAVVVIVHLLQHPGRVIYIPHLVHGRLHLEEACQSITCVEKCVVSNVHRRRES